MSDCGIRRNGGHGVWVEQGTVRIEQCSLEDNAGYGIHNSTPDTVPAQHNWWGDPAGPRGSSAKGIDGPVRYEPFLVAPPASLRATFCVRLVRCDGGGHSRLFSGRVAGEWAAVNARSR